MPETPRRDDRVPAASAPEQQLNALLGRGSEFDGKLKFEGTVRIDGTFSGEITTGDTLIVGEGAKVAAEIACGAITVRGEVTGNIRASRSVELFAPARVRGDIATPSLSIEKGVVFHGQSKMEEAGAKPAATAKDKAAANNVFRLGERERTETAAEA
ncbi:MAG TPA: polymer-forming cytoskeletal protein [Candidatus Limnocylindria bacterium]|nr:polymer-forming cytoskeletal protein [Candidatus Limnocylindria bacterium]